MAMTSIQPPLSTAITYILLALAERDLHGYGIMQETGRLSAGEYKMGPGTLYDNLKPLLAEGLVREVDATDAGVGPRKLYRLTQTGARVLRAELQRMDELLRAGRARLEPARAREGEA
jgi:DNA-binding PadR family transcriptional regulator